MSITVRSPLPSTRPGRRTMPARSAGTAGPDGSTGTAAPGHGTHPSPADRSVVRAIGVLAAMTAVPMGDLARPALRDRAIEAWLPLCRRLARRYRGRGVSDDDLLQVASVGLIKAVDRYDPGYGTGFIGFAVPTVTGEIKRYFRDRTWAVRVPRSLQDRHVDITAAKAELTHVLGRSPTVADVAAHLGITEDETLDGFSGGLAYRAVSLSAPVGTDGLFTLADTLGAEDHGFALTDLRLSLSPALAGLSERDARILTMRFYGNLTQLEIAERIGLSQMHISRLITQSLSTLRRELSHDDF
ncbi:MULTISPECIES: SigB/SigF/SigG family RNA polymerase sigma factor [Catenuloplanes]|uniref:RNA polymerase sigma-B factor n=1 Tax=Catenuloplanes niger TaxID=587534 RepID=A0AAE3ZNL1_9ACTN|nr:SigB/SigF/SigG family RNA polymerase sigma factor [Catenuloplanes niger]MDR7321150.1 RNA polymerase sigma-B factor [Catenuloplanes niger]